MSRLGVAVGLGCKLSEWHTLALPLPKLFSAGTHPAARARAP